MSRQNLVVLVPVECPMLAHACQVLQGYATSNNVMGLSIDRKKIDPKSQWCAHGVPCVASHSNKPCCVAHPSLAVAVAPVACSTPN